MYPCFCHHGTSAGGGGVVVGGEEAVSLVVLSLALAADLSETALNDGIVCSVQDGFAGARS